MLHDRNTRCISCACHSHTRTAKRAKREGTHTYAIANAVAVVMTCPDQSLDLEAHLTLEAHLANVQAAPCIGRAHDHGNTTGPCHTRCHVCGKAFHQLRSAQLVLQRVGTGRVSNLLRYHGCVSPFELRPPCRPVQRDQLALTLHACYIPSIGAARNELQALIV